MPKSYSTCEIIDLLGGNTATAALTRRPYNQVYNWRAQDHFPPVLYLVMLNALAKVGVTNVPPSMWRMVERAGTPAELELARAEANAARAEARAALARARAEQVRAAMRETREVA